MEAWDKWRSYIAEGGKASWPRDAFESMLDCIAGECEGDDVQMSTAERGLIDGALWIYSPAGGDQYMHLLELAVDEVRRQRAKHPHGPLDGPAASTDHTEP